MRLMVLISRNDDPEKAALSALTFDDVYLRIGRAETCEIRLPDATVSHHHASLHRQGRACEVVDEGSAHGTFLANLRLPPHERRSVSHGSSLCIGPWRLELRIGPDDAPAAPLATHELALAIMNDALAAHGPAGVPRVFVRSGLDRGKVIPLPSEGESVVLGRGLEADVWLDEAKASRRHLRLTRPDGVLHVGDLASRHGTLLGGAALRHGAPLPWPVGEELRIGEDVLVYEDPLVEALAHLDKQADEIREPPPMEVPSTELPVGLPELPPAPLSVPTSPPIASFLVRTLQKRQGGRRWDLTDVVVGVVVLLTVAMIAVSVGWLFYSSVR